MKPASIKTHTGRWSVLSATLTAITGIAISVFLYSRILQSEASAARLNANALRQHIEQELSLFAEVLESVRALHALSGEINQAAMDEFIEKGMVHQQTILGTFGLAQRIDHPLRLDVESKEKPAPGAYDLVHPGADGTWIPAPIRTLYYPLTWKSRADGLNVPIGFDFLSTLAARKAIGQMEHLRQTVLVPEPLPDRLGNGYWVFAPVIPRNAPHATIGCAAAVLHPENILRKVSALSASSPKLQLNPAKTTVDEEIRFSNKAWTIRLPLHAISTEWAFECSLPVTVAERRSTAALISGLTVTALMTILLLILAGRTRHIEDEVLLRTEELRVANLQLEENLSERARMEEAMNELAAHEQRRIGRDLHDSLGQKLTGAVFLSRSLLNWFKDQESEDSNSELRTLNPELSTHAKTLNETLKDAVSQVRRMARGLASVTLNDENLTESLSQLADEMNGLYDADCKITHVEVPPSLDRKAKEQLYFIAREAVNNAARHAQANRTTVQLKDDASGWTLRVEDDGRGLSEGQPAGGGMGIRIMKHRASLIAADFSIDSHPGKGTTITVTGNPEQYP